MNYSDPDITNYYYGFTGHEHLDDFGLINMNGRMYDPILAMLLSPDPFIQSPETAQNFNRYAYVMNNPLKYTDPEGYVLKPCSGADNKVIYYYDDETDEIIWPWEIDGRESYYYGHGWSSVTTSPKYRQGKAYEWVSEVRQIGYEYSIAIFPNGNVRFILSPELATIMSKKYYPLSVYLKDIRSKIWNSWPARLIIKDLYILSFEANSVPGFGGGSMININVLLRGKRPGVFFTHTPNIRIGAEGSIGVTVSHAIYTQGRAQEIIRSSILGNINDLNTNYSLFGIGLWTSTVDGTITWIGTNTSISGSLGPLSIGRGITYYGLPKDY